MILLTTSRRPTGLMRTFCRDLERTLPNVIRINRGKLSLDGLTEKALELGADRVIVVDRWQGGIGKIQFFNVNTSGLVSVAPIMYVGNVKLQREFTETRLKPAKSLVILKPLQNSAEMQKVTQSLSEFLNIPVLSVEEATSKGFQVASLISLNASNSIQITFLRLPTLKEIGPSITIKHLIWEIGETAE